MSTILLARHGQASWGKRDYDQLSPLGTRQGALLGEHLAGREVVPSRVVVGGMRRHRQTAEAAIAAAGWEVEPEVDPGWDEFDHMGVITAHKPAYRSMTLMRADLVRTLHPRRAFGEMFDDALTRWTGGVHDDYEETFPVFADRVDAALERLSEALGADETAVVVTSAGPVCRSTAALLDGGASTWLRLARAAVNSGVTTVSVRPSGPRLVTFNEHSHLLGEGLVTRH